MSALSVLYANLSQIVPGLLGFGAALLWFAVRSRTLPNLPHQNLWWGALAGLSSLVGPDVVSYYINQIVVMGRFSSSALSVTLLTTLPTVVLWLIVTLIVLISCVRQREDLLRRGFGAAALFGWLIREIVSFFILGAGLLLESIGARF